MTSIYFKEFWKAVAQDMESYGIRNIIVILTIISLVINFPLQSISWMLFLKNILSNTSFSLVQYKDFLFHGEERVRL